MEIIVSAVDRENRTKSSCTFVKLCELKLEEGWLGGFFLTKCSGWVMHFQCLQDPCCCSGFIVFKWHEFLQFMVKVYWSLRWFFIFLRHVITQVFDELTCLFELHQLPLVLLADIFRTLWVVSWNRNMICNIASLKKTEIPLWIKYLRLSSHLWLFNIMI